jgi:hypothetical protein
MDIIFKHVSFIYVNKIGYSLTIEVTSCKSTEYTYYTINFIHKKTTKSAYIDKDPIKITTPIILPTLVWDIIQLIQISERDTIDHYTTIKLKLQKILVSFSDYVNSIKSNIDLIEEYEIIKQKLTLRFSKQFTELHNENQLKEFKIIEQQQDIKSINAELEEEREKNKQILIQLEQEKEKTKLLQNQLTESYTGLSFSQANMIGQAMFESEH